MEEKACDSIIYLADSTGVMNMKHLTQWLSLCQCVCVCCVVLQTLHKQSWVDCFIFNTKLFCWLLLIRLTAVENPLTRKLPALMQSWESTEIRWKRWGMVLPRLATVVYLIMILCGFFYNTKSILKCLNNLIKHQKLVSCILLQTFNLICNLQNYVNMCSW